MMKRFFAVFALLLVISCSPSPRDIQYGKDFCMFCKMTILDPRFAAEVVTTKGKIFTFDDLLCAHQYVQMAALDSSSLHGIFVTDFQTPHPLRRIEDVILVQAPQLRSPMGGDIAAFAIADSNAVRVFFSEYARVKYPSVLTQR